MKKLFTLTLIGGVCLTLVNCSSSKKSTSSATTEKSPADKIAEIKAKYTDAQLAEGKEIWSASCDKCHKLYEPGSRSVDKWERVLPRMFNRAKLDDNKSALVRAYLIAHASAS